MSTARVQAQGASLLGHSPYPPDCSRVTPSCPPHRVELVVGGGASSMPLHSFKPLPSEALDGVRRRWVPLSVELHFHQMSRGLFTRLQPLCPVLELFIRPSTAGHRRGLQGYHRTALFHLSRCCPQHQTPPPRDQPTRLASLGPPNKWHVLKRPGHCSATDIPGGHPGACCPPQPPTPPSHPPPHLLAGEGVL